MKIAVDAMGGDNAPKAIVEGVSLAQQDFPDVEFLLYGKESEIKKYLTNEKNITIIHTDEKINSDDEPVKAIRRKKTASMVLAAQAVKNGEADAIFFSWKYWCAVSCRFIYCRTYQKYRTSWFDVYIASDGQTRQRL
jgi:fatty acid/phospholipid biosynthesis enzyme